MENILNQFTNHSGGCAGADMLWDTIGKEMGFKNHKHYRQAELKAASDTQKAIIEKAVYNAAIALGRPTGEFKGKDLIRRNWFQAHYGDRIFAISYIIEPNATDARGFTNTSGKQVVAGGTGWTVEMAIQMEKTVFVYDMSKNRWFIWSYTHNRFVWMGDVLPSLSYNYAGIGTRTVTQEGIYAIRQVYENTINFLEK